jgi:hypothetical protein
MFGIGHLLKRMQNRQTREYFVRERVREAVREATKVDIIVENIKINGSVVSFLNLNQSAKSEVYIKKQQLLKLINSLQDIVVVTDLR